MRHGITFSEATSLVCCVVIIVAVAVPHLRESRETSQESAAAAALKSCVLPAEVQFQAGGLSDRDGNGIGTYCVQGASGVDAAGAWSTLSGASPIGGQRLTLLAPAYAGASPVVFGYR